MSERQEGPEAQTVLTELKTLWPLMPGGNRRVVMAMEDAHALITTLLAEKQALEAERDRLAQEEERLRDALRLIELFGYREGEEFGWINAHMRGTATAALEGQDLSPHWRLFPNHRPRTALRTETGGE